MTDDNTLPVVYIHSRDQVFYVKEWWINFLQNSIKEGAMPKQRLLLILTAIIVLGFVTSVSAATTLKQLARSPFYRPGVSSAADLKNLVKDRNADLQAGFAKAGYPYLYPAFMQQFPNAKIAAVKVPPGETFAWMLFKNKKNGRVVVLKDVTWGGKAPFDAYQFTIDEDGKRYVFLVPGVCGNVTLRSVAMIPSPTASAPVAAPAPPTPAPAPVAATAPPAPVAAPAPPPPAPAAAPVAAPAPQPVAAAPRAAAPPPPVAPAPVPVPPPVPPPVAKPLRGLLADVGLSRQPDPANYLFARVGYELPLTGKLYLMGLVGGYVRWMGEDGGSAFTADAMLDYHWMDKVSLGLGAGYWSGNDGQVDLLANLGFLVWGAPDSRNCSIFFEARLPADNLDELDKFGRFGVGLRERF